jgi:hypothetical protein
MNVYFYKIRTLNNLSGLLCDEIFLRKLLPRRPVFNFQSGNIFVQSLKKENKIF